MAGADGGIEPPPGAAGGSHSASDSSERITIGICALDRKAHSKPMTKILDRLCGEFEVVIFGDECILEQPIEHWPRCDVLVSFFSQEEGGKVFPLAKAQAYLALRQNEIKYVINDLQHQYSLLDRRQVYQILADNGIATPPHIVVSRDENNDVIGEEFVEGEDYVQSGDKIIHKPFVEKPISGEDHNICIYYPHSVGGGMKGLFRKVDNRSSEFHPGHHQVRRDGSYIYEGFLRTGGTDVKVYTVGPDYAHAEARKSPTVDGRVLRGTDGKEERHPVLLSPEEKDIARRVCLAFKQGVCGFDLLRCKGRSYVCDVNGWSFVKKSTKYYDDAARVLRTLIIEKVNPKLMQHQRAVRRGGRRGMVSSLTSSLPSPGPHTPEMSSYMGSSVGSDSPWANMNSAEEGESDGDEDEEVESAEELRCVLAVIRHGDRTPKQKIKVRVTHPLLLDVLMKHGPHQPGKLKQAKLKSPKQLQELLDAVRLILRQAEPLEDPSSPDDGYLNKLRQVKDVLEQGGQFSGINRKAQLKPLRWESVDLATAISERAELSDSGGRLARTTSEPLSEPSDTDERLSSTCSGASPLARRRSDVVSDGDGGALRVTEALLIMKHGGVLTHTGRMQAEQAGRHFRSTVYPQYGPSGGGLLRLHSTYRHDLKIYSSDEGRVQMTAAAFCKGLLDLEGTSLAPILISLVTKDAKMLDAFEKGASEDIQKVKDMLYEMMNHDAAAEDRISSAASGDSKSDADTAWPTEDLSAAFAQVRLRPSMPPCSVRGQGRDASSPLASDADEDIFQMCEDPSWRSAIPPNVPANPSALLREAEDGVSNAESKRHDVGQPARRSMPEPAGPRAPSSPSCNGPGSISSTELNGSELNDPDATLLRLSAQSMEPLGPKQADQHKTRLPYGGESVLLMAERWGKLDKGFYIRKQRKFDISKVPDIYDSAKYDAVHNIHMGLRALPELLAAAKVLADSVIPNEYGISPEQKIQVGKKICGPLMDKLLTDLHRAREESEATWSWEKSLRSTNLGGKAHAGGAAGSDGIQHSSGEDDAAAQHGTTSKTMDDNQHTDEDADDDDTVHRLDPRWTPDVRSPYRHVRSRLYFTSESHIHSLVNTLRYSYLLGAPAGRVSPILREQVAGFLDRTERDYLTHIVILMYERMDKHIHDENRFRIEILFSPGTVSNVEDVTLQHDAQTTDLEFVDCHAQTLDGDTPSLAHLTEFWRCCDQRMPHKFPPQSSE